MTYEHETPPPHQNFSQTNLPAEQAQGVTCSKTYTSDAVTPSAGELGRLTEQLEQTLCIPGQDPAILARQSELLDQLFTKILQDKVHNAMDEEPALSMDMQAWLHFALRIQKQCTDTFKARAAAEYMGNLSLGRPMALPHPRKNRERNE